MDRLVNFLQDDLEEIDESFEHIKDIMEDKIYYENMMQRGMDILNCTTWPNC